MFKYSLLWKELKKQIIAADKQYQKFDNSFDSNEKEEIKTKI